MNRKEKAKAKKDAEKKAEAERLAAFEEEKKAAAKAEEDKKKEEVKQEALRQAKLAEERAAALRKKKLQDELNSLVWSDDEETPNSRPSSRSGPTFEADRSLPSIFMSKEKCAAKKMSLHKQMLERSSKNKKKVADSDEDGSRPASRARDAYSDPKVMEEVNKLVVAHYETDMTLPPIEKRKKDHVRSKYFRGSIKLKALKGLLPREVEAEKEYRQALQKWPDIPIHVVMRLGEQVVSDLWKFFLDQGADNYGYIRLECLESIAKSAIGMYGKWLPFRKIKYRGMDADDFISFRSVVVLLCRNINPLDTTTSGVPLSEIKQMPNCCSIRACARHTKLVSSIQDLGSEERVIDNHVLDVIFNRIKLEKNGVIRNFHVFRVMDEAKIPYEKKRLPESFWHLRGAFVIATLEDLEYLVSKIRTDRDIIDDEDGTPAIYKLPKWLKNEFTPSEILLFRHNFGMIDVNGGGSIDEEELISLTAMLGSKITMEQAKMMVAEYDLDRNGTIDFSEFMQLMFKIQRGTIDLEGNVLAQAMSEAKSQLPIFDEIEELQRNGVEGTYIARYGENPIVIEIVILGPVASPYEGGKYLLKITFFDGYPFRQPEVVMLTRLFAPNVILQLDGQGMFPHIKYVWNSSWSIRKLVVHVKDLMIKPDFSLLPIEMGEIVNRWVEKYEKENPDVIWEDVLVPDPEYVQPPTIIMSGFRFDVSADDVTGLLSDFGANVGEISLFPSDESRGILQKVLVEFADEETSQKAVDALNQQPCMFSNCLNVELKIQEKRKDLPPVISIAGFVITSVTEDDVRSLVSQAIHFDPEAWKVYGTIVSVTLIPPKEDIPARASVVIINKDWASQAVAALAMQPGLGSECLSVEFKKPPPKTIIIKDFSSVFTEEDVREILSAVGAIESVAVIEHEDGMQATAEVVFAESEFAFKAVEALNKQAGLGSECLNVEMKLVTLDDEDDGGEGDHGSNVDTKDHSEEAEVEIEGKEPVVVKEDFSMWIECDDGEGNIYYYNNVTGFSEWELPINYRGPLKPGSEEQEVAKRAAVSKALALPMKPINSGYESISINSESEILEGFRKIRRKKLFIERISAGGDVPVASKQEEGSTENAPSAQKKKSADNEDPSLKDTQALMNCLNRIEQMHLNVMYCYLIDKDRFAASIKYYNDKSIYVAPEGAHTSSDIQSGFYSSQVTVNDQNSSSVGNMMDTVASSGLSNVGGRFENSTIDGSFEDEKEEGGDDDDDDDDDDNDDDEQEDDEDSDDSDDSSSKKKTSKKKDKKTKGKRSKENEQLDDADDARESAPPADLEFEEEGGGYFEGKATDYKN